MLTLKRLNELNEENNREDTLYIVESITYRDGHYKNYLYENNERDSFFAGSNDLNEAIKDFKACIKHTSNNYDYYDVYISEAFECDGDVVYEPMENYRYATIEKSYDSDYDAIAIVEDEEDEDEE